MYYDDDLDDYDKRSHRKAKYVKNKKAKDKALLDSMSIDKYNNEFKNDFRGYLDYVFRFDDMPKPYVKPEPIVIAHPFDNWL